MSRRMPGHPGLVPRIMPLAVLTLLHAVTARAETMPAKGLVDERIRAAVYDSAEVYRLHGQVGQDHVAGSSSLQVCLRRFLT